MSEIKLKQFIRDNVPGQTSDDFGNVYSLEGRPPRIGVLVSTGPGKIGFSIISPKEDLNEVLPNQYEVRYTQNGKEFVKTINGVHKVWSAKRVWDFGTRLATERANGEGKNPTILPRFIERQVAQFEQRMKQYYK